MAIAIQIIVAIAACGIAAYILWDQRQDRAYFKKHGVDRTAVLGTNNRENVERLARYVTEDPRPLFRRKCLDALLEWNKLDELLTRDLTRTTLEQALRDDSSAVALLAALHSGDAGHEVIRRIAATPARGSSREDGEARASALQSLIAKRDHEVSTYLESAVDDPRPEARTFAIRELARLGHRSIVSRLCQLASTAEPETAVAIADALGVLGEGDEAEAALLLLLELETDPPRIAAARALGQIGRVGVVPALREHAGGLLGGSLSRTAGAAIRAIQERAGDVEPGVLSLAPPEAAAGGLSAARGSGGLAISRSHDGAEPDGD